MRVLALGGSGDMGRKAVETILRSDATDQVVVADLDLDRARSFCDDVGDGRVRAERADVLDEDATAELMSGCDVVMNTAGPFFRLGVPAIRAAIAAKRPYADVCDDYRPTQEALELDTDAKAAGVPVVIGIGASPGITNLLARKAYDTLGEVEHVQTVWGSVGGTLRRREPRVTEPGQVRISAALVHFLYSSAGTVPVFRDGRFVEVTPLDDGEEVAFPNGTGTFYVIGHPEPVTIPRFCEGIRSCVNLCGESPETYAVLRELGARVAAGELTADAAADLYVVEREKRVAARPPEGLDMGPRVGGLHASASGPDGLVGYGILGTPDGGMAGVTGVPLAIAVEMLMHGEITETGVLAPEACIDPDVFFERYAPLCAGAPDEILYEVRR